MILRLTNSKEAQFLSSHFLVKVQKCIQYCDEIFFLYFPYSSKTILKFYSRVLRIINPSSTIPSPMVSFQTSALQILDAFSKNVIFSKINFYETNPKVYSFIIEVEFSGIGSLSLRSIFAYC